MDEEFLINIVIAGKKYPLTIKRHEEELARAAADQINSKILQYRQHFAGGQFRHDAAVVSVQFHLTIQLVG